MITVYEGNDGFKSMKIINDYWLWMFTGYEWLKIIYDYRLWTI